MQSYPQRGSIGGPKSRYNYGNDFDPRQSQASHGQPRGQSEFHGYDGSKPRNVGTNVQRPMWQPDQGYDHDDNNSQHSDDWRLSNTYPSGHDENRGRSPSYSPGNGSQSNVQHSPPHGPPPGHRGKQGYSSPAYDDNESHDGSANDSSTLYEEPYERQHARPLPMPKSQGSQLGKSQRNYNTEYNNFGPTAGQEKRQSKGTVTFPPYPEQVYPATRSNVYQERPQKYDTRREYEYESTKRSPKYESHGNYDYESNNRGPKHNSSNKKQSAVYSDNYYDSYEKPRISGGRTRSNSMSATYGSGSRAFISGPGSNRTLTVTPQYISTSKSGSNGQRVIYSTSPRDDYYKDKKSRRGDYYEIRYDSSDRRDDRRSRNRSSERSRRSDYHTHRRSRSVSADNRSHDYYGRSHKSDSSRHYSTRDGRGSDGHSYRRDGYDRYSRSSRRRGDGRECVVM